MRVRCVPSVLLLYCLFVWTLGGFGTAQSAPVATDSPSSQTTPSANSARSQSIPAIKASVHHVVVDVVAIDKHGLPVRNLTEKDFEISERVGWVGKVQEKISDFRLVDKTASMETQGQPRPVIQIPPDAYSNLVATREPDEPLT